MAVGLLRSTTTLCAAARAGAGDGEAVASRRGGLHRPETAALSFLWDAARNIAGIHRSENCDRCRGYDPRLRVMLMTASYIYIRDFRLFVPRDCVAALTEAEQRQALEIMERNFAADTSRSEDLDLSTLLK